MLKMAAFCSLLAAAGTKHQHRASCFVMLIITNNKGSRLSTDVNVLSVSDPAPTGLHTYARLVAELERIVAAHPNITARQVTRKYMVYNVSPDVAAGGGSLGVGAGAGGGEGGGSHSHRSARAEAHGEAGGQHARGRGARPGDADPPAAAPHITVRQVRFCSAR